MTLSAVATSDNVISKMLEAWNEHDIAKLMTCFGVDFESSHPIHPNRSFKGVEQIRQNWQKIFESVSNLKAELLRSAHSPQEGAVWIECRWYGTFQDGSQYDRRGVMICGIENAVITWMRAFTDPVDEVGPGVNESLDRVLKRPTS